MRLAEVMSLDEEDKMRIVPVKDCGLAVTPELAGRIEKSRQEYSEGRTVLVLEVGGITTISEHGCGCSALQERWFCSVKAVFLWYYTDRGSGVSRSKYGRTTTDIRPNHDRGAVAKEVLLECKKDVPKRRKDRFGTVDVLYAPIRWAVRCR